MAYLESYKVLGSLKTFKPYSGLYYGKFMNFIYPTLLYGQFMSFMLP